MDDKRHAQRTSWQSLITDFLRKWLNEGTVEVGASQGPTPEERKMTDTFLAWLRDPDPREAPYKEAILGILRSYRAREPIIKEEAEGNAPPKGGLGKGNRSRDGQSDSLSKGQGRVHRSG